MLTREACPWPAVGDAMMASPIERIGAFITAERVSMMCDDAEGIASARGLR